MDSHLGDVLRKARNRRKVELSEVETATRIRLRYLQAIEAEDWGVLPGGVYTRGFIRTYANFLGLDGDRLVEDYRAGVEGRTPEGAAPASGATPPRPSGGSEPGRDRRLGWIVAAAGAVLVAAAVIALLPGSDSGGVAERTRHHEPRQHAGGNAETQPRLAPSEVSLQLTASAEVWVCLLGAGGKPLVDGQILEAGAQAGPFRSGSFTVSFGNGEVSMTIDGSEAEIPATSSPIGYSIDPGGRLSELSEGERPTCS
jgi:cytoskeleton protein RodZ